MVGVSTQLIDEQCSEGSVKGEMHGVMSSGRRMVNLFCF